ncbi:hypothetical protein [Sphaerotilus hippei]|nr:hypothetical protein [Sphaerotilus hippei]
MESALIGLLGVIVGSALATLKDWWLARYKMTVDGRHLSLLAAFMLERYVQQCAEVAMDSGEEDQDGMINSTTKTPTLNPGSIVGDWRTIPVELTNALFDLQLEEEATDRRVSNEFEYAATPPDYSEWFEERQYGYAILGIAGHELANRFREYAGLPARAKREWPLGKMLGRKEATERMRRERP